MKWRHKLAYWLLGLPEVSRQRSGAAGRQVTAFKCLCGAKKLSGRPFCKACYDKLPKHLRKRLMSHWLVRRTYVLALESANKRVQPPV